MLLPTAPCFFFDLKCCSPLTRVCAAWASAFFFEVAGITTVLLYFRPMPTPKGEGGPALGRLDPAYLRELWQWNRNSFPWFLLIDASICFVRSQSPGVSFIALSPRCNFHVCPLHELASLFDRVCLMHSAGDASARTRSHVPEEVFPPRPGTLRTRAKHRG